MANANENTGTIVEEGNATLAGATLDERERILNSRLDNAGDATVQLAREFIAAARSAGDRFAEVRGFSMLGYLLCGRGDFGDALRAQGEANALLRDTDDAFLRSKMAGSTARIFLLAGDYSTALDHYHQASEIAVSLDAPLWKCQLQSNFAVIFRRLKEFTRAREYADVSLAAMRRQDDPLGLVRSLNTTALVYAEMMRLDEAAELYREAIAVSRERGFPSTLSAALTNLGDVLRLQGDAPGALECCDEAARVASQHHLTSFEAQALFGQAHAAFAASHTHNAIALHTRALGLLADHTPSNPGLLADIHRALAACHETAGAPDKALASLKLSIGYDAELKDTDARIKAQTMAVRIELETTRLERDNARYAAENERLRNRELEGRLGMLAERAADLDREAHEDALTGTYNRRHLDEHLDRIVAGARRAGKPIAVCMIDIDRFKDVNDRYSHRVGDRVLARVAEKLKAQCRDHDFVVRYGGEEFVVVLPGLARNRAASTAERLRAAVAACDWCDIAEGLAVTISIGIADDIHLDADALLALADHRLYLAKAAGRNRVVANGGG